MKRVEKPWGHEMIWAVTDRYVGKVLHIKAGQKLSLQYHQKKDETVMVWSGRMNFEHFVEGLVHVSSMADDYYRFIETAHMLRGENTQKTYRLGDKVKVQVIRVNMEVRQIDLGLVEILERVRQGEQGPRRSKTVPKHEKRKKRLGKRERGMKRRRSH